MTDRQTDAPPQVIDFEAFATLRGASRLDYCEDGAEQRHQEPHHDRRG